MFEDRGDAGGRRSRDWLAIRVVTALLLVQSAVAVWLFAGELGQFQGKQWTAFALLVVFGGLRSHIERHRDAYRDMSVSWPLLMSQIVSFVGIVAVVRLTHGGKGPPPDVVGSPLLLAVPAVSWLVCSLASIAPRGSLRLQILGTAVLFAAAAVAAWNVGDLTTTFWHYSGGTTMRMVEWLLQPFADGPVVRPEPFVIGTDRFHVQVNPPCSGFHGIGLVSALLAGYLWWFRRSLRFPQALLLLPVGVVLMWLANAVRIAALILVGIWISPDIAVDGFHSAAGWIAFLAVGLGLIWGASRSRFFTQAESPEAGRARDSQRASSMSATTHSPKAEACLVPFLVLTAATLLTQAFTSGFDWLYPVRVVATAAALCCVRRGLPWRQLVPSVESMAVGLGVFVLWMLMAPAAEAATGAAAVRQDPFHLDQPWRSVWLLFRLVGSTITVPIAEELFFRGFVTRRCIDADVDAVPVGAFSWFSFLVSSVSFGVLHGDAWIAGTMAGMAFAAALYRRRRIVDAVVAHATTNALLSAYVISTGSWSQWG